MNCDNYPIRYYYTFTFITQNVNVPLTYVIIYHTFFSFYLHQQSLKDNMGRGTSTVFICTLNVINVKVWMFITRSCKNVGMNLYEI